MIILDIYLLIFYLIELNEVLLFLVRLLLKDYLFPLSVGILDRGREYCGSEKKHEFVKFLKKHQIQQKTTKSRHPWTNGKAERVIRTLLNERLK